MKTCPRTGIDATSCTCLGCVARNFRKALGKPRKAAAVAAPVDLAAMERELAAAQAKSLRAMDARRALPAGSSRARVTTANARWANAAEHRDRVSDRLDAARGAPPIYIMRDHDE